MFKKFGIGVMLFLMAVTIPIVVPCCNTTSAPTQPQNNNNNNQPTVSVNTPTNKYFISFMILDVGGLGGCGMGMVEKDANNTGTFDESIYDAHVTINGSTVDTMLGMYTKSGINVTPGTPYNLVVTRAGTTIATGTATMPSKPTISSPVSKSSHTLNTALSVTWAAPQYATCVMVSVSFTDPGSTIEDSTVYSSNSLPVTQTSIAIPQTVFTKSGSYIITVNAVYGIPPNLSVIDSATKGYNITGPAGLFCAINSAADTVYVNYSGTSKKKSVAVNAWAVKEKVLSVGRKWFPHVF